jgi:hypothetical protein
MKRSPATRKTSLVALATAVVLGGVTSALGKDNEDKHDNGGFVRPCSLDGVNPALHPEIFGSPDAAKAFGFVLGPDHAWHVTTNCRAGR